MLVFDIGCNRGEYTLSWLQRDPKCRVICVDANPAFQTLYQQVVQQQNRITFINKLVTSNLQGKKDFFIDHRQTGISTASQEFMRDSRFTKGSKNLPPNSGGWFPIPVKVETTTLDELIDQHGHPDIVKIDVEGHEYEVVAGLSQKVGMVHFEWHEEMFADAEKAVQHLISLGYTQFHISGYFEEGDTFKNLHYDNGGDTYNYTPSSFYSWEELVTENFIQPDRRINYGMLFAK
jgi:FkbM family methyltransferase